MALVAEGRAPATNMRLTEALAQKAAALTWEEDESVKVFSLCSWVTDELDAALLKDPERAKEKTASETAAEADAVRIHARPSPPTTT